MWSTGGMVLLLAGGSFGFVTASQVATGVVFEDRNGNGRRDAGESGVPGVAVSNGREVERTAADGSYRLPVTSGTILFLTKPAGFQVPLDDDNLPQFFYRHDPDGTPAELGLRYGGIEPSGRLPDSIDFPLRRSPPAERFEAIWISDPQPQTAAEVGYVRDDVVAELIGTDAAFGITLGDIMYDDLALIPRYNRVIAQIGIPWYNVPGNHELNYLSPDDGHSLETFKRYYGPSYYSFDYGQVHFVVLDDVHYLGRDAGRSTPHPRGKGRYEGRIGDEQLAWLENDLKFVPPKTMVVLAMHIPLAAHDDTGLPESRVTDSAELLRLVADREHVMAVAGHMHTTEHLYLGAEDGFHADGEFHLHVLTTVSGSWWSGPMDERGIPTTYQRDGTPNGYHVMTVAGNRIKLRYKAAGEPADRQMRISLDTAFHMSSVDGLRDFRPGQLLGDRIDLEQVHSTEILVNLFDGGPKSTVRFRIGRRPAVTMARVNRNDPFIEELFIRHADTVKSWVGPEPSSHLWAARLPADLGPGVHTITVHATDEYGQEHVGHRVFEVVAGSSPDGDFP
jgi:hypothetical protein